MAENANKTVNISIDDFQYYIRRDDRLSMVELLIRRAKEENQFIDPKDLLVFVD